MTKTIAVAIALLGCATRPAPRPQSAADCRCTPGQPCWPTPAEWARFGAALRGRLEQPRPAVRDGKNPFALQDQSGGSESAGWLDAWTAAPSAQAVVARDAADVAAAVNFARERNLRLVIKGTGHDYLGRSSAPDSLLVWTHEMRQVTVTDAFVPQGCTDAPVPAVTVEAGTRWIEAYQEVSVRHGRYVQGGGCTSVGAAGGFIQGGGFGSWSKKFGIAAASMLEAEVVTADGRIVVANRCQNQDLFWALRGGGGGTFGVVTHVTLQTHPLPEWLGGVDGKIEAKTDAAFRELLERFVLFYRGNLNDEHWGEQIKVFGRNVLELSMVSQGVRKADAERIWAPFKDWIEQHRDVYEGAIGTYELPGRRVWDTAWLKEHAPDAIRVDERKESPADRFWWAGDEDQVSAYWYAYKSRWLPFDRFDGRLADALFQASRHWTVGLHFNKGQSGAAPDAVARGRETPMNPAVFDAAALVIIAAAGDPADRARGERARGEIAAAMNAIPGGGSYVNETDWFEPDWQRSFWGDNYGRLLEIKRKYDPGGLFFCHHCVGSENWSADGMCRAR